MREKERGGERGCRREQKSREGRGKKIEGRKEREEEKKGRGKRGEGRGRVA